MSSGAPCQATSLAPPPRLQARAWHLRQGDDPTSSNGQYAGKQPSKVWQPESHAGADRIGALTADSVKEMHRQAALAEAAAEAERVAAAADAAPQAEGVAEEAPAPRLAAAPQRAAAKKAAWGLRTAYMSWPDEAALQAAVQASVRESASSDGSATSGGSCRARASVFDQAGLRGAPQASMGSKAGSDSTGEWASATSSSSARQQGSSPDQYTGGPAAAGPWEEAPLLRHPWSAEAGAASCAASQPSGTSQRPACSSLPPRAQPASRTCSSSAVGAAGSEERQRLAQSSLEVDQVQLRQNLLKLCDDLLKVACVRGRWDGRQAGWPLCKPCIAAPAFEKANAAPGLGSNRQMHLHAGRSLLSSCVLGMQGSSRPTMYVWLQGAAAGQWHHLFNPGGLAAGLVDTSSPVAPGVASHEASGRARGGQPAHRVEGGCR